MLIGAVRGLHRFHMLGVEAISELPVQGGGFSHAELFSPSAPSRISWDSPELEARSPA
jgi:hypothetical protein